MHGPWPPRDQDKNRADRVTSDASSWQPYVLIGKCKVTRAQVVLVARGREADIADRPVRLRTSASFGEHVRPDGHPDLASRIHRESYLERGDGLERVSSGVILNERIL